MIKLIIIDILYIKFNIKYYHKSELTKKYIN